MVLYFFGNDFSDVFYTFIISIAIGVIMVIIFQCFVNTDKSFRTNSHLNGLKKKGKKKIIAMKPDKESLLLPNFRSDLRHIDCKTKSTISDEDVHDGNNKVTPITIENSILINTKNIFHSNDSEFLDCLPFEFLKDRTDIERSQRSSNVSELHFNNSECSVVGDRKISRNQKRRLKAKLKPKYLKQPDTLINSQFNNSNLTNQTNIVDGCEDCSVKSSVNQRTTSSNKHPSLKSTSSSECSEIIQSRSSLGNEFQSETLETGIDEDMNEFVNHSYGENNDRYYDDNAEQDQEIEDLKEERYYLQQKIDDLSSMNTDLKTANEIYLKKYDGLEQTCNALKNELTLSIQKNLSVESQFGRYKSDRNRQIGFYENEISILNNKINVLENDIQGKIGDQENLKKTLDKIHQLLSDKDKHIQNQSMELSSLSEQLHKNRGDSKDLESQIKKSHLKLKEVDSQMQLANKESKIVIEQMDILKNEKNNVKDQFDLFKKESKVREQEQDRILYTFQYKLDELLREKHQALGFDKMVENTCAKDQISGSASPLYYQVIEPSTIKQLPSLVDRDNERLQDKCNQYEHAINDFKDGEKNLVKENLILNEKYCNLNIELEGQLKKMITLNTHVENLESQLLKYSEISIEELQLDLSTKCDKLCKAEDNLTKLKSSVSVEEKKWSDCLNESRQENIQLKNELNSQASLVSGQNKRIFELTNILQSYSNSQNEALFNGSSFDGFSESFHH